MLPNRAATDEIYSVEPGASWDGVLTWDNYGDLEDGDYRMVWSIYVSSDSEEDSAASYLEARFSLKDGHVVAP